MGAPKAIIPHPIDYIEEYFMVRPRKSMKKTSDQIRDELIADLNACSNSIPKKHPPMKNIYNYHPDCPYADRNTGIVLESHYQYWRFYPQDIIQSDETIKHRNNDRTDNNIKNLVKGKKQTVPEYPVDMYMHSLFNNKKNKTHHTLKQVILQKKLKESVAFVTSEHYSLEEYQKSIKRIYDDLPSLRLIFPIIGFNEKISPYISYEDYCPKFNERFKERVRAFFGHRCAHCGELQSKVKHSVHHVYYNKSACCEVTTDGKKVHTLPSGFRLIVIGSPNKFVPLCKRCHSLTNTERLYWAKYFEDLINTIYGGRSWMTPEEWDVFCNK